MNDYRALLRAPRFRAFWLALLAANLGSWCVIATLPILVAQRYGAGMVLVLSLGLRIVPKVLLAPLAGGLLRRFGPARVASSAMVAMAVLTAGLPWCDNLILFQAVIGAIGTIDLFINPGLLALRGAVTPAGLSMAGNTMFSVADRAAKVAGPALGGVLVLAGFAPAFAVFAAMTALAAIPIARFSAPPDARAADARSGSLTGFVRIIRADRQIVGLLIASVTYMVMLGGLRPFLFWANRDWFGASDTAWTGLLVAQGAGALIGAVVSALFVGRFLRGMSAYTLTMLTGIMEGAVHLLLLFAQNSAQAILILALAGIPEIISTSAWFTAMQERLAPAQQALFFTFAAPMWDLFFALGIASAGLHARGVLSLSSYWALVSLIATVPLIPLLGRGAAASRAGWPRD
ncbi:MAG TPA: hypothetical protein DDZ81_18255 [Acetobacteraceae bacterium]|jgi:hypothetical protein|nr:hypothetical protein [Acetobacteraceae bacterium]